MESDPIADLKNLILQLSKKLEEKSVQDDQQRADDDERYARMNSRIDNMIANQYAWGDSLRVLKTPPSGKGLSGANNDSKFKKEEASVSGPKQFVLVGGPNDHESLKKFKDNTAVPPNNVCKGEFDKLKARIERMCSTDNVSLSDVIAFNTSAPVPIGFTMPTIEKFDGTGPPRTHLSNYSLGMMAQGANEEMAARFFQLTLKGSALCWYLQLDPVDRMNWKKITNAFYKQYECNQGIEVTKRDLEAMKQGPNETFSEYVACWRRRAAQMVQRPSEEEQVRMVVKSLIPALNQHLFSQYLPSFKQLMIVGGQVEDALREKNEEANWARGFDRNDRSSGVNAVGFGPVVTGTTDTETSA